MGILCEENLSAEFKPSGMTPCVLGLEILQVSKYTSRQTAQHQVILLRLIDLEDKEKLKYKFHPRTGYEGSEGT